MSQSSDIRDDGVCLLLPRLAFSLEGRNREVKAISKMHISRGKLHFQTNLPPGKIQLARTMETNNYKISMYLKSTPFGGFPELCISGLLSPFHPYLLTIFSKQDYENSGCPRRFHPSGFLPSSEWDGGQRPCILLNTHPHSNYNQHAFTLGQMSYLFFHFPFLLQEERSGCLGAERLN